MPLYQRLDIIKKLSIISMNVDCPHSQADMLAFITSILSLSVPGCFVEAGCYKGGSTAKFSLAVHHAGRRLFVFDSFEGIPPNDEPHNKSIFGTPVEFHEGDYCGTFLEVKDTINTYGYPDVCELVKGWFEHTMPGFHEPIAGIYLDCDLASSTRTCLIHLYPKLEVGGVVYSQDGHLPLVLEVFDDDHFWEAEVGCRKPRIEGLGTRQLIKIVKEYQP